MHKMIMNKENLNLNCFYHVHDLYGILAQTCTRYMINSSECPRIVVLLDHQLDCITGLDVLEKVKNMQCKFKIEILWILVSSTEDKNTIARYEE